MTGATGFVGSFLADWLEGAGADYRVLVREGADTWRLSSAVKARVVTGDLDDHDGMRRIFEELSPGTVIHTAWRGVDASSRELPLQFANLNNTRVLFELAGAFGCRKFIGFGSQDEYGIYNEKIDEDVLPRPVTLYGVNKLSAGLLGRYYAGKFGYSFAWLRIFSTFGPRETPGFFIPSTITALMKGESPALTACTQTWDYLYVKDVARLVGLVLRRDRPFNDAYNLCSGIPVVLKDVVLLIRELLGSAVEPGFGARPFPVDGRRIFLGDMDKFYREFGAFRPSPLEDALRETVVWYKENTGKGCVPTEPCVCAHRSETVEYRKE